MSLIRNKQVQTKWNSIQDKFLLSHHKNSPAKSTGTENPLLPRERQEDRREALQTPPALASTHDRFLRGQRLLETNEEKGHWDDTRHPCWWVYGRQLLPTPTLRKAIDSVEPSASQGFLQKYANYKTVITYAHTSYLLFSSIGRPRMRNGQIRSGKEYKNPPSKSIVILVKLSRLSTDAVSHDNSLQS